MVRVYNRAEEFRAERNAGLSSVGLLLVAGLSVWAKYQEISNVYFLAVSDCKINAGFYIVEKDTSQPMFTLTDSFVELNSNIILDRNEILNRVKKGNNGNSNSTHIIANASCGEHSIGLIHPEVHFVNGSSVPHGYNETYQSLVSWHLQNIGKTVYVEHEYNFGVIKTPREVYRYWYNVSVIVMIVLAICLYKSENARVAAVKAMEKFELEELISKEASKRGVRL